MPNELKNTEDLKAKYRDLVTELEAKEQEWTAMENVLRTAVVRLAIAGMGQSTRLDKDLGAIRDAVKKSQGPRSLSRKIDGLTKTLTKLDLSKNQPSATKSDDDWFIDLLYELKNNTQLQPGIDELTEKFQRNTLSLEQGINHLGKLFAGLDTLPTDSSDDAYTPESGDLKEFLAQLELPSSLRQQLLTDFAPNSSLNRTEAMDALAKELNALLQPSGNNENDVPEKAVVSFYPDINALIGTLTEQFDGMPELHDPMIQIRGRLDNGIRDDEWEEVLGQIADHISRAVHSARAEKSELETFLQEVTKQLSEFENWTAWHQDQAQGRLGESVELQEAVSKQVSDLREDMEVITDVTDLKTKVRDRLDSVAEYLKSFRTREAERLQHTLSKNAELQREISTLKDKTGSLIKLWGQQRNQLMFDTLTNVYSRYAYDQRLLEEFQRWQRHPDFLVFSIWDIDRFKRVNDTYGHGAGDRLLQLIAGILLANTRTEDFLARIGGEEFVMLLPSTEPVAALQMANKLRQQVQNTYFHYKGTPEKISISCGLTHFQDDDTPLTVYNRADAALYEAKSQGRNCCVAL